MNTMISNKWFFLAALCFAISFPGMTQTKQVSAGNTYSTVSSSRISKEINLHWTFNYFPDEKADQKNYGEPQFDDSKWPEVAVPHSWQLYETTGEVHPFIRNPAESDNDYWWKGWGWYRKHFTVDKSHAGKKIFLEFDGVMKNCKVYINGHYLGDHKGGYSSFDFDITDFVKPGTDNVLAVAVNNLRVDTYSTPPMKAGNWNTYGGIMRDVRLVIKSPLYIPMQGSAKHEGGTFITTPSVSKKEAVVRVQTYVQNDFSIDKECTVKSTIVDRDNKVVQVFEQKVKVPAHSLYKFDQLSKPVANPHLWAPGTPYVYKVYSEIFDGNKTSDKMESPLGFRWFYWDYKENFMYVNGQKVVFHGGNRHEEYPWLGQAIPKWISDTDFYNMAVNLNYNFMRTAHYPNDAHVYDLTDKYGIVINEELPNDKNQEFSREVQEDQLKEMIRRDRNHPSILFWSMGNETNHAADSKWTLTEDTTRIITARRVLDHSEGDYAPHSDKNLSLENLLACNVRGWYDKDVKNLEPTDGQHAGTEENQHRKLIASGRLGTGNLSTWLYADHGCDREYLNEPLLHVNPKGYVDAYRVPKYSYYIWQATYLERPMVWIMPHFWRSQYIGQKKDITVDANGEKVELFVNGISQGTQFPTAENFHSVTFKNVEIKKGEIKAVAVKKGKPVVTSLMMADAPAKLKITSSHTSVTAAKNTVLIVTADIVDRNGVHVFGATNPLKWSVKGPATLVGPDIYNTDINKTEEMDGTMYVDAPVANVIRSTGEPGDIIVTVQSPNLVSSSVTIHASAAKNNNTGITEPSLPKSVREKVLQNQSYAASNKEKIPAVIIETFDEFHMPGKSKTYYADFIRKYLADHNKNLDVASSELKALIELFSSHMVNNDGRLVADDYNFNIDHFNKVMYLDGLVDKTTLPNAFKESLKKYYIMEYITKGVEKDLSKEKKQIVKLPAQGRMAVVSNKQPGDKELTVFAKPDIDEMIQKMYPAAASYNAADLENVKSYLTEINPFISKAVTNSQVRGEDRKTVITYTIQPDEILWFPELSAIPKKTTDKEKKKKKTTED
ncbi:MAG TPA: glycoside hydrolase family 2 TIM barrel-domain containing protein [Chitinophagaceae bacterium]